MHSELI